MNVKETGCEEVDWVHLTQRRAVVKTVMKLRVL